MVVIGQRWRYNKHNFYIIAEIIALNPVSTKILQANFVAIVNGYTVDSFAGSMGIDKSPYYNWELLQGQDKSI
jgi:hypothetical protein